MMVCLYLALVVLFARRIDQEAVFGGKQNFFSICWCTLYESSYCIRACGSTIPRRAAIKQRGSTWKLKDMSKLSFDSVGASKKWQGTDVIWQQGYLCYPPLQSYERTAPTTPRSYHQDNLAALRNMRRLNTYVGTVVNELKLSFGGDIWRWRIEPVHASVATNKTKSLQSIQSSEQHPQTLQHVLNIVWCCFLMEI